ncbi:MAG TPA: type IV toxin-antitoxin system AbiEi family antitoxin [Actinopolymorphaceae bacterium]|jgi:DNA-binding Lrp family transcriptional regulator
MQTAAAVEAEAYRVLPDLLQDLLGNNAQDVDLQRPAGSTHDIVGTVGGRQWVFEVKESSRPGIVAAVAEHLPGAGETDAVTVLVVPFMTPAGARSAAERSLNWLDLSGNAHVRTNDGIYVHAQGRPNRFPSRGRPSSPFAPKSSRIAHVLLLDPAEWWRQKALADATGLDDSQVSRVVRRLTEERLVERRGNELRPRDPWLLLDAWAEDYRFDRHDVVIGHATGSGLELAHELHRRLDEVRVAHAFTGLPAAWAMSRFARFRLNTVYVHGDPRTVADAVDLRRNDQGANVQIVGPDDRGVFLGQRDRNQLPCVSPAQVYLDLGHLPERAADAARQLRDDDLLWHDPS